MKHHRKLNRKSSHRLAMLRTMVTQLIEHERIRTTLPKAKELRRVAEKVVTMAKQGDEPARKRAQNVVRTPEAVSKLFDVVGPRYALREGGYTRILKADFRKGDGAEMAIIEYVDRYGRNEEEKRWKCVNNCYCWSVMCRPGEMRKAKPVTGIEAARAVFEAEVAQ